MSDHLLRMSSSFLCFPAKYTEETELFTSHGMHMVKVHINLQLKSHLNVALWCWMYSVTQLFFLLQIYSDQNGKQENQRYDKGGVQTIPSLSLRLAKTELNAS